MPSSAVTYVAYDVVEVSQPRVRSISPDVGVWRTQSAGATSTATAVVDLPQAKNTATLEVPLRLANVEVRETGTDLLVTAIEILSPVNKRKGLERNKYLRKRRELLRSEVHLMEIDLLRGGNRSPLEEPLPPAPYYVTLCRADTRPNVDVWAIQLDARLPVVPVPLLAPDPDVPLDLGAVISAVYERGAYDAIIHYGQPVPPPALTESQQAWVEKLLS
jgi:hypothetical protein